MTAARQPVPRRRAPRVRDDRSGPPWPSRAWYLILLVLVGASASCSSTGAVANAPLDSSVSPMPAASVEPLTGSAEASLPTTAPSASTAASAADYNCPSYTSTIDQVRTTHGGALDLRRGRHRGFQDSCCGERSVRRRPATDHRDDHGCRRRGSAGDRVRPHGQE